MNESTAHNRSMLPPIFSGPSKKTSQKTGQLIANHQSVPVRASMQAQQQYMSESSPMRFNHSQPQYIEPCEALNTQQIATDRQQ